MFRQQWPLSCQRGREVEGLHIPTYPLATCLKPHLTVARRLFQGSEQAISHNVAPLRLVSASVLRVSLLPPVSLPRPCQLFPIQPWIMLSPPLNGCRPTLSRIPIANISGFKDRIRHLESYEMIPRDLSTHLFNQIRMFKLMVEFS